jgi:hypothetical protein
MHVYKRSHYITHLNFLDICLQCARTSAHVRMRPSICPSRRATLPQFTYTYVTYVCMYVCMGIRMYVGSLSAQAGVLPYPSLPVYM